MHYLIVTLPFSTFTQFPRQRYIKDSGRLPRGPIKCSPRSNVKHFLTFISIYLNFQIKENINEKALSSIVVNVLLVFILSLMKAIFRLTVSFYVKISYIKWIECSESRNIGIKFSCRVFALFKNMYV